MAAPFGKADAKIGGEDYTLVFNFGAMAAIEQKFDRSFQSFAAELSPPQKGEEAKEFKISSAAMLLWGCLRAKHSHVSFDEAGEMLMGDDGQEVVDALLSCLGSAFPEEEKPAKNPRKRAGTGQNS